MFWILIISDKLLALDNSNNRLKNIDLAYFENDCSDPLSTVRRSYQRRKHWCPTRRPDRNYGRQERRRATRTERGRPSYGWPCRERRRKTRTPTLLTFVKGTGESQERQGIAISGDRRPKGSGRARTCEMCARVFVSGNTPNNRIAAKSEQITNKSVYLPRHSRALMTCFWTYFSPQVDQFVPSTYTRLFGPVPTTVRTRANVSDARRRQLYDSIRRVCLRTDRSMSVVLNLKKKKTSRATHQKSTPCGPKRAR